MMPRWSGLALAAALMVAAPAGAQDVRGLKCDRLIQILLFDELKDQREDAAEEIGERPCAEGLEYLVDAALHDSSWEVRETSVWALAEMGTPDAMDRVQALLEMGGTRPLARRRALEVLLETTPSRAAGGALAGLAAYRTQDPALSIKLLQVAVEHQPAQAGDVAVLIARDASVDRGLRVAALKAAEAVEHPRQFEACLGFLADPDRKLRERCIAAAARPGLPSAELEPLLEEMARTSADGGARAAALDALRFHAHPGLVPLAHEAVLHERSLAAWGRGLDLLEIVADERSVPVLAEVLDRDRRDLTDGTVVRLIHLLVRIGDPAARPALEALAAEQPASEVTGEAAQALALLGDAARREAWLAGWAPRVEYQWWDPSRPDAALPPLSVSMGADGVLVFHGAAADAGCAPPVLHARPTTTNSFDLWVDGRPREPIGEDLETGRLSFELDPGLNYVRVASRRGDRAAWSVGTVDCGCGEVLEGEISASQGLSFPGPEAEAEAEAGEGTWVESVPPPGGGTAPETEPTTETELQRTDPDVAGDPESR